jgi:hypothetical protein
MLIRWWCIGTIMAMYRIDDCLTLIKRQGASKMTYRAVEPKTSFPTFDLFLMPIKVQWMRFSRA